MLVIFIGIVVVTVALIVASPLPRRARQTEPAEARADRHDDGVSTWMVIKLGGLVVVYAVIKGVRTLVGRQRRSGS